MDIEAISGAATVALASTVVFLAIAISWNSLSRVIGSAPTFAGKIMHEAAQRFRDELERLSRWQATYLSGALVFIILFFAAYALRAEELFAGYPAWQLWLQIAFLALAAAFAGWRTASTILARHEVKFIRDANLVIGHQLQQIAPAGSRVFHDVTTAAGVVDHLVVGPRGIYGINVVARRGGKRGSAFLQGNELIFSERYGTVPVVRIAASTSRLEREINRLLGHKVRIRSVIAVPGWDVREQASDNHLLVNERTLSMLCGWRDSSDHLLNEDVEAICDELTVRCSRRD